MNWNPFYQIISTTSLYEILTIFFPISLLAYISRVILERKKKKTINKKFKNGALLTKQKQRHNISDVKATKNIEKKPIVKTNYLEQETKKRNKVIKKISKKEIYTINNVNPLEWKMPDIILGCDKIPVQWGIIGKSNGNVVGLDLNEPHIVFVCGKQGSGKGYTIGGICEMLLSKSIPKISKVSKPATIIVFHKPREDIRNEFWSIIWKNMNEKETEKLKVEYGVQPARIITEKKLKIFLDPFVYYNERHKFQEEYETEVYPIGINPSRLTSEDWPHILSIGKRTGSIYVKKIFQIIKKNQYNLDFGIERIKKEIDNSELNPNQKNFAHMRLETLQDYLKTKDFINKMEIGAINIFDLRKIMMEPDDVFSVMILVISSILNNDRYDSEQFVFVINEAHDYLRKGLSKEFTDYINYLVRKKRHAGTWLMLDTHFPEDVDNKIIKGSDLKIFHKSDILSSHLLNMVLAESSLKPHRLRTGQAIVRADKSINGPDKILLIDIRPRITHHGAPTKFAVL
jgi:hypothetical protein